MGNFEEPRETPAGTGKLLKQKGETKPEFLIPAGEKHHVEEMTWTWDFSNSSFGAVDFRVIGLGTHMHYVGRDMLVTLEHGDESENPGDKECLIQTPSWDFNWQRGYTYDAPREDLPVMGQGDVLRLRCTYDNSVNNRFVAEALDAQGLKKPVDVPLGENTLDEMCLIGIGIMYPNVNAGKTIGNEKADAGVSDADASQ